jgi:hypothetical protein
MQAFTTTVQVAGETVTVRELTVAEIRNWFKTIDQREIDTVSGLLFEDLSLDDLPLLSDISAERVDNLPPSELAKLIAAIKEANSAFFTLRGKLFAAVRSQLQIPASSAAS